MDIQKFDLPPGSEIRVFTEHETINNSGLAFQGWRLLAIVSVTQPVSCPESSNGSSGYTNSTVYRELTSVRYVMVRDESAAVDDANRRANGMESDGHQAKMDLKAAQEKFVVVEKEACAALQRLSIVEQSLATQRALATAATAAGRAMEVDIAKLRAALGELRMKEILGA